MGFGALLLEATLCVRAAAVSSFAEALEEEEGSVQVCNPIRRKPRVIQAYPPPRLPLSRHLPILLPLVSFPVLPIHCPSLRDRFVQVGVGGKGGMTKQKIPQDQIVYSKVIRR